MVPGGKNVRDAEVHRGAPSIGLLLGLVVSATFLSAAVPAATQSPGSGSGRFMEITFIDVGHGDAAVVRGPDGTAMMVDAGAESPLRPIARLGIDSLSLLVATHPHADHIGGIDAVLTARPVARYLDSGMAPETALHERLLATLRRVSSVRRIQATDTTLRVGTLSVDVLAPQHPRGSVGLVIRHGDFAAFLPGDAGRDQLTRWLEAGQVPDVTVLKASDHGSVGGFTHPFVAAARPQAVVISAGRSSEDGFPRAEALTAYRQHANDVLRTDVEGHITIRGFEDGRYEILTGEDIDDRRPRTATAAADSLADGESPTLVGTPITLGPADVASASPGVASALAVRVVVDEPGTREGDLNGDYAIVANRGAEPLDLSGWRLCDLTTRCFRFPPGSSVPPGRQVAVYAGYGYPDGVSFFMNNDRRVWNENGDEATLYDADGQAVVRYVY